MELAKLLLEYIKALAWPILVGVVLWWFRKAIAQLVNRIATETESLKGFGVEAKFLPASPKDDATALKKEVASLAETSPEKATSTSPQRALESAFARYLLAEELVLRSLERRWSEAILRDRVVELPNGRRIRFDGVLDGARQVIAIEVKLLTSPAALPSEVFINAAENSVALGQHVKKPVLMLIALVAPEETEAYKKLAAKARERADAAPANILIEFYFLPQLSRQLIEPSAG